MRDIGKVVGQSELGDKKAEEFEGQLAKFDESKPGKGQTAALLFYFSPEYPVMSVSNASIEGQMMERLGLENIFANEKTPYSSASSFDRSFPLPFSKAAFILSICSSH